MTPELPVYRLPGDERYPVQHFVATERIPDGQKTWPLPVGLPDDAAIRGYVGNLWEKSFRAMEPEHFLLNRRELYYSGFHLADPLENFEAEITNYPFANVETVVPELTSDRPRPEIQPMSPLASQNVKLIEEWHRWLLNTNGFDSWYSTGMREMMKLGWIVSPIAFDPKTGMPYPKLWPNWDFYPDFTATGEDNMMHFFLAGPIPTRMAKSLFPHIADQIAPDNWVSPSYDVLVRPYLEQMGAGGGRRMTGNMPVGYASYEGQTPYPGSTFLTAPGGSRAYPGETSFLFQLFVRDMSYMDAVYAGKRWMRGTDGSWTWHWAHMRVPELVCGSGWRVIQMFSNGAIADVSPLEDCYDGLPIVMGRDYKQAFRFFSPGEIDHIIPKVRAINRRLALLNLALEYECNPAIIADKNCGYNFDKGSVVAGDVIKVRQGSKVDWMNFHTPAEQQFLLLAQERGDVDNIGGVHDPLRGNRPPGIEAGIAIEKLQSAGRDRIKGKEGAIFDMCKAMSKKLTVCAARKLNRRIQFRATNGQLVTIDPEVLQSEYEIGYAKGSGLLSSRNEKKSESRDLFQLGAIDQVALLKDYGRTDAEEILQRAAAAQEQAMQMKLLEMKAGVDSKRRGAPAGKAA